jgi:hypothetical protein
MGFMKKYNLLLVDNDPFILEGIGEDLDITSSYCPDCAKKTMDEFTRKSV